MLTTLFVKHVTQPTALYPPYLGSVPSSNSYQKTTEFSKPLQPERIAPINGDPARFLAYKFLEIIPPPSPDCSKLACVALTFDDGPNIDSTAIILDALERNLARATFFVIGDKVTSNTELLQRMQTGGNEIGNHSWSHPSFLTLKSDQINHQVEQTQKAIAAASVPKPRIFRPPYGDFRLDMQKDIKLAVILWDVDPKDWSYSNPDKIATLIETQIKPGSIVVLHDKPATALAIYKLMPSLKNRYRFVTVSELLKLQNGATGVYLGR